MQHAYSPGVAILLTACGGEKQNSTAITLEERHCLQYMHSLQLGNKVEALTAFVAGQEGC